MRKPENTPTQCSWVISRDDSIILKLYVQPGASKTKVAGPHGDKESTRLKIQINAPPIEGKANERLISFLSKVLGIPKSRIEILRGQHSREKDVLCYSVATEEVMKTLCPAKPRQ